MSTRIISTDNLLCVWCEGKSLSVTYTRNAKYGWDQWYMECKNCGRKDDVIISDELQAWASIALREMDKSSYDTIAGQ